MYVKGPTEPSSPYAGSKRLPPGLVVIDNFVTALEEEQLLAGLDWTDAESGQSFCCVVMTGVKFCFLEFVFLG